MSCSGAHGFRRMACRLTRSQGHYPHTAASHRRVSKLSSTQPGKPNSLRLICVISAAESTLQCGPAILHICVAHSGGSTFLCHVTVSTRTGRHPCTSSHTSQEVPSQNLSSRRIHERRFLKKVIGRSLIHKSEAGLLLFFFGFVLF